MNHHPSEREERKSNNEGALDGVRGGDGWDFLFFSRGSNFEKD
jgi:hypothetical protein